MLLRFSLALLVIIAISAIGQVGGRYSNLGVKNSVDVAMPVPGAPVEFTVEVTNYGDYLAENVTVQDTVEPPLQYPKDALPPLAKATTTPRQASGPSETWASANP